MDIDMGWLLQCLDRFLNGGTYKSDFYETNPPLSFLVYLPAYPFFSYLGLDPKISVFMLFMGYIVITNLIVFSLLKSCEFKSTDIAIILCACIIGQTWGSAIPYGSKDHLILMFMIPLCLYQSMLTSGKKATTFAAIGSVVVGATAICLKPHYGFITALFFLHRMYSGKPVLSVLKAPDFLGLFVCGMTYVLFVLVVTPEFFEILPEIMSIYGVERPFPLSSRLHYGIYAIIGFVLGSWLLIEDEDRRLKQALYAFTFLSLISFIPYLLQDKGWHYHAIPILSYGMMSLFIASYTIAKKIVDHTDVAIWVSCGIIAMISYMYTSGGKGGTLTNGQYMAQPLVDKIDERAWNRVYATYGFQNMLTPLPYISDDLKNGSRFGQLWTIGGLLEKMSITEDENDRKKIKEDMYSYVDMIVVDMRRFKPSVITIPQFRDPETDAPGKKYYEFLMNHEGFRQNMDNYVYEDTLPFDYTLAINNTNLEKIVPHDVFILKRDHSL